jgi:hypothetical protein
MAPAIFVSAVLWVVLLIPSDAAIDLDFRLEIRSRRKASVNRLCWVDTQLTSGPPFTSPAVVRRPSR